MAGVKNPFQMSVIKSCIGIIGCGISLYLIRIVPRRIILMTGGFFQAFFQLACAIAYQVQPGTTQSGNILVAFSILYNFVYCATIAPYSWVVGGEIPSQRLRGYTFGISAGLAFVSGWLITFTAPYFINPASLNWGPKVPSHVESNDSSTDISGSRQTWLLLRLFSSLFRRRKIGLWKNWMRCSLPKSQQGNFLRMSALEQNKRGNALSFRLWDWMKKDRLCTRRKSAMPRELEIYRRKWNYVLKAILTHLLS